MTELLSRNTRTHGDPPARRSEAFRALNTVRSARPIAPLGGRAHAFRWTREGIAAVDRVCVRRPTGK